MNGTLIRAFWRERLTSPVRLVLLFTMWTFVLILAFLRSAKPLPPAGWTTATVLILGIGLIGRDVSTGVLQLILARPVGRAEYVVSRWLGLASAGFAVGLAAWAVVLPSSLNAGTMWPDALRLLAEQAVSAFGMAAVITALSALLPGLGDLALLAMGTVLGWVLDAVGNLGHLPWAERAGKEILATLFPSIDIRTPSPTVVLQYYSVVTWISVVTLALFVAVVALNRRELSYATTE